MLGLHVGNLRCTYRQEPGLGLNKKERLKVGGSRPIFDDSTGVLL